MTHNATDTNQGCGFWERVLGLPEQPASLPNEEPSDEQIAEWHGTKPAAM